MTAKTWQRVLFTCLMVGFVAVVTVPVILIAGNVVYDRHVKPAVPHQPHKLFGALMWPGYEGTFVPTRNVDLGVQYEPVHYKINAFGFRTHEFTLAPSKGVTRILCLGGSSTLSIQSNRPWPEVLEDSLSSAGYNVEVLNLGVAGWDLKHVRTLYVQAAQYLNPSIIIIYEGYNSFQYYERETHSLAGSSLERFFTDDDTKFIEVNRPNLNVFSRARLGYARVGRYLAEGVGNRLGLRGTHSNKRLGPENKLAKEATTFTLEHFAEAAEYEGSSDALYETLLMAKRKNILPIVVAQNTLLVENPTAEQMRRTHIITSSHSNLSPHKIGVLMNKIEAFKRKITEETGGIFVDLRGSISGDLSLLVDAVHYSQKGNQVFGEKIAQVFVDDERIRGEMSRRHIVTAGD